MNQTKYQLALQKATLRWGRFALIVMIGLLLVMLPKSGSNAEEAYSHIFSSSTIVAQNNTQAETERLSSEAHQFYTAGNYERAIELWQQVILLYQVYQDVEDQNQNLVAVALGNIGWSYFQGKKQRGYLETARIYFERALSLYTEEARENKAKSLNGLAQVYNQLGMFDRAVALCLEEASIWENIGSHQDKITQIYIFIATIYYESGNSDLGAYYLAQVEELIPRLTNLEIRFNVLLNYAAILARNNRVNDALDCINRAYSYYLRQENWFNASVALNMIAVINRDSDRWDDNQSINFYLNEVLPLAERGNDRIGIANIYQNVGSNYVEVDSEKALSYLTQAKNLYLELEILDKFAEAQSSISDIYFRQEEFSKSLEAINSAIAAVEILRVKSNAGGLRSFYFSTAQTYYDQKVFLLMHLVQAEFLPNFTSFFEVLNTLELVRARTLNELLVNSNVEISSEEISPSLRAEVDQLQQTLNRIEMRINTVTLDGGSLEELTDLKQEYTVFSQQLNSLTNRIQSQNPSYANRLRFVRPYQFISEEIEGVRRISSGGLGDESVLLQYYVRENRSFLFVTGDATPGSYAVGGHSYASLPGREVIEERADRFYQLLKNGRRSEDIGAVGACLRQTILPQSILDSFEGKRLVIIADDVLHKIPFGALPLPRPSDSASIEAEDACSPEAIETARSQPYNPLIAKHEIVNIPSLTTLKILRQQQKERAPKTLAILADTIFSETDPRITEQGSSECTNMPRSIQSQETVPETNLSPGLESVLRSTRGTLALLPCTRTEAEAILKIVDDPSQTRNALDFDATQAWVTESPLSDYRLLHFATHAFADNKNPELSGLVMSRFNRQRQHIANIEDDILNLSEIYHLRLNADLVVLSACETGLGENLRGEGIIGLTRGFMVAGARRVISSLWNVEDSSTAQLMEKLYNYHLHQELTPAAALRQAQLDMWKEGKRPNQWAAFTFQGEWRSD